jgi:hypothetical protein
LLKAEFRIRTQGNLNGIYDGENGIGTGHLPSTLVFPVTYLFINVYIPPSIVNELYVMLISDRSTKNKRILCSGLPSRPINVLTIWCLCFRFPALFTRNNLMWWPSHVTDTIKLIKITPPEVSASANYD